MKFEYIKAEINRRVMIIRLNRPDSLNSFIMPMAKELQAALDQAAETSEVQAVLLTGEGRGFCAGQDLKEAIAPDGPPIKKIVNQTYNPIIIKIREIEKPVIGVVNGVAAGAGANIAFACDITLAAKSATFIQSFSKIGLIPDSGGTFLLPRLIGLQRATALMMLAEKITADQALQWGLVYKVYEDESLMDEAFSLANLLASMPTAGLGLTKRALNAGLSNSLREQLEVEAVLQEKAAQTHDHKEGVQAFLDKRAPQYTGK